jgi:hypothetical protein
MPNPSLSFRFRELMMKTNPKHICWNGVNGVAIMSFYIFLLYVRARLLNPLLCGLDFNATVTSQGRTFIGDLHHIVSRILDRATES